MSHSRNRSHTFSSAMILGLLAGAVVIGSASEASAQELRFSTTAPGGIAAAGNTLGLAKALSANGPGVQHSIGAFISLDAGAVDAEPLDLANPWPAGTTSDWTQNGSDAVLQLPAGAEVLYAELVWAGSYRYGAEDVLSALDQPILVSAGGSDLAVAPDPTTGQTLAEASYTGFAVNYYLRSADVTAFVRQQGAGVYAVSGVPATQATTVNSLNAAGWSLVVAYRNDTMKIRNLSVFVGGPFVDEDTEQDYTVSGFCAPPYGAVEGNVVVSAVEGDANLTGDMLALGESSASTFAALEGPNNPVDNFFCSQINGADGELDVFGSFGSVNHDPFTGMNVPGGRQGWDLTTVPVSSLLGHIANDQQSAVIRTTTTGDSFMPTLVALEIDVNAPDFSESTTEASAPVVELDDTFTVTATATNTGEALATDLLVALPLDEGLVLEGFKTDGVDGDANGAPVSAGQLAAGIPVGDVEVGDTRTIELELRVVGAPNDGVNFDFQPHWGHTFVMCHDQPALDETFKGPAESVAYHEESTGAGGEPPTPSAPAPLQEINEEGSCGCSLPGRDAGRAGGLLLGLGLAAAAAARRRRR